MMILIKMLSEIYYFFRPPRKLDGVPSRTRDYCFMSNSQHIVYSIKEDAATTGSFVLVGNSFPITVRRHTNETKR